MSLNIRLKHSATKDKKPQVADLKAGELALNTNSASAAGYALDDTGAVQQMFGKATETQEGQAEIATQPEVDAGTDDERIVTPAKLGQRLTDYTTNTVDTAVSSVDSKITAETTARKAADSAEATTRANDDGLRVLKAGDTMTGALSVPAGASGTQAPQVQEVVKKTGDTMTGALALPADPTKPLEAATKAYVDAGDVGGPKAWGSVAASGSLESGLNIATTTAVGGAGVFNITFSSAMPNTNYAVLATSGGAYGAIKYVNKTVNGFSVNTYDTTGPTGKGTHFPFSFVVFAQ